MPVTYVRVTINEKFSNASLDKGIAEICERFGVVCEGVNRLKTPTEYYCGINFFVRYRDGVTFKAYMYLEALLKELIEIYLRKQILLA